MKRNKLEEYCTTCGTRYYSDNIIQSYDYNSGIRYTDIEKAQKRIEDWKVKLIAVREELIEKMIPITFTGTYKKAGIPIGKTYFIKLLGLVEIVEKYGNIQRVFLASKINEIGIKEYTYLVNRIYQQKKSTLTQNCNKLR